MGLSVLIRLIKEYAIWFVLLPGVTAGTVFYLTRNEPKIYKSQATIYTGMASGYTVLSDQKNFIDQSAVTFENLLTTLKSPETIQQISLHLLSRHLKLSKPDGQILSAPGFQKLQQAIPPSLRAYLLKDTAQASIRLKLDSLARSTTINPIVLLLHKSDTYYSVKKISGNLKANRRNPSDMLDMEYESEDGAVSQQTLREAIDVLNIRYTRLKTSETNSVVAYYQDKVRAAKVRLDNADKQVQAFNVQHNLVNFEEESKNVAASAELTSFNYNDELMKNSAAKASMDALSRRMVQQGNTIAISGELKSRQADLAQAQTQLANAQAYGQAKTVIEKLQTRVEQTSGALKNSAEKYAPSGDSPESVPQRTLVGEWLARVLEYEESAARLKVYESLLSKQKARATEYSPLESQLRQLNRELTSAEKDYLATEQSLNQAIIHRQDVTVDKSLTVLDAPNYPLDAQSKRWLFVAIGLGVGLFIAVLLMAFRIWLDRRIITPNKAESLIGKPVIALFPTIKKLSFESKTGRTGLSMLQQLCDAINIETARSAASQPPVITIFSIRSRQGKTWLATGIGQIYGESGQRIAFCYPQTSADQPKTGQEGVMLYPYVLRTNFMHTADLRELFDTDQQAELSGFDKIIMELPPLISCPIPVQFLNQSSVSLLVTDVNGIWGRTETQLLGLYLRAAMHPVLTVLNRVAGSYIDAPSLNDVRQRPTEPERATEAPRSRDDQPEMPRTEKSHR
ncbi:GumC family protein [Larkinella sp.]|uniref:GumC family protein n=1 Tax=Larkinella sp. TaxID=2034517 RepID=UPI003BACD40C